MPGFNCIPGVSQLKSTFQIAKGDFEGAAETQKNFARECPGVSQVTSVGQLLVGDTEGTLETQKRCLNAINNTANAIPLVGHVKGIGQHIVRDSEGGNRGLRPAKRTTFVIGSGTAISTGGLGAIPVGMATGASYDTAETVVTDKPQGYVAAIGNAIENPSAGTIFDAAAIPVGDGFWTTNEDCCKQGDSLWQ